MHDFSPAFSTDCAHVASPSCPPLQLCKLWYNVPRPARLQSDNGTEFCAAAVKQLCKLWGVEFVQGAVGHPQSQVSLRQSCWA